MDLTARIVLVVAALAIAGTAWALLQRSRGQLRATTRSADLPTIWRPQAGERLTLVQISSEHCSTCAQSLRVWRAAIADAEGTALIHADAADHLDVVGELGIRTTPTTLVYDTDRALVARVVGAPTKAAAVSAVRQHQHRDGALA